MITQIKKEIINLAGSFGYNIVRSGPKTYWPTPQQSPLTSYDIDSEFHDLYDSCQTLTRMTDSDNPLRRQRHYSLMQALKNAPIDNGVVAECGCWKGLSTAQIATVLKGRGYHSTFHVFDSFEGLSEIDPEDLEMNHGVLTEETRKEFACELNIVKSNLSQWEFIQFYKGWIPERFQEITEERFSFVHIDVDMYSPILRSLEFFYPRLAKMGLIVLDDYGCSQFPGAKKAVDQYLESLKALEFNFHSMPAGSAILQKL